MCVSKKISEICKTMLHEGIQNEYDVMHAIEKTLGGKCFKSSKEEDTLGHIDVWWESPKKGRLSIDVKGVKKNSRKDTNKDDTIHWIEFVNVRGNRGWLYGDADYIAFMTTTKVWFVKRCVLVPWAEEKILNKDIVYKCPSEFYIPYQRYGRLDKVMKIPTSDIENLAEFAIEL